MFDSANWQDSAALLPPESPSLEELQGLLTRIGTVDGAGAPEAELIDQLSAMERLKAGLAAAQVRVTATLAVARSRAEATRGIPASKRCRGLATEITLARRESPHRGGLHYGMSMALVHEMPHTRAALARGDISEFKAMLIVKETAVLTREHRRKVDAELAGRLAQVGDRQAAAEARKIGYRLDPGSALRRSAAPGRTATWGCARHRTR